MRGIHTKPIAQPSEEDAYQNAVSSLMRQAAQPATSEPAKEKGIFRSFSRRSTPPSTASHRRSERIVTPTPPVTPVVNTPIDDEHRYRDNIFGPSRPSRKQKAKNKPANVQVQLSINLKKPSFGPVKRFAQAHKSQLMRVGALGLCLAIVGGGIAIYNNRSRSDSQGVAGATYIAPRTVFLPRPVPEGYTVGSSKQELENGAILYTIYGPSGEEITITQQSEPANFKDDIFKDALRFNTPYGIGYVIEDMERTTGFLLAEDSWVLINSPRGFPGDEMRTLIRSLQPI